MATFEMMRFILSFILSSFLFAAPLMSSAGDMPVRSELKIKYTAPAKNMEQENAGIECPAHISTQGQQHSYSTRCKNFSTPNFINENYSIKAIAALCQQQYSPQPYHYCKPINLKLLFPKHYFW